MQKVRFHKNVIHQFMSSNKLDLFCIFTVPLHVLYSYDDSSGGDEEKNENSDSVKTQKSSFQPTNRTLNKMPPVHRIIPRESHGKCVSLEEMWCLSNEDQFS